MAHFNYSKETLYHLAAGLLLSSSLSAFTACNHTTIERDDMVKDKSESESQDDCIVLGQELADARAKDAEWKQSGGGGPSALPEESYDFWKGELNLINPAPTELDAKVRQACHSYAASIAEERIKIRKSISIDQFYTLIAFAKRSAVLAMRDRNPATVTDGLVAIAMIEIERVDYRDILMSLGILHHAAGRSGGDAVKMFTDAAALAEPKLAEYLLEFTNRAPEDQGLRDAWGYDEVETEYGIGLIGWGFEDFHPNADLSTAIIEVASVVASDYESGGIEVATELPDVWLGKDPAVEKILSRYRGCASFSGSLRPNLHKQHQSQQFTVFLVDANSADDAQRLFDIAAANQPKSHNQLALVRSNLFCLVVARSFVQGTANFETSESLQRFQEDLAAVLARHAK